MKRLDVIAFEATRNGDLEGLKKVIHETQCNQHEIFALAVKNNKDHIIEWMMNDLMTQQCYPLGRLDIAVVANILIKHGEQRHLEILQSISRGHISGLIRPENMIIIDKRGLNINIV